MEYVPATQLVHEDEPMLLPVYDPAAQLAHADRPKLGAYRPTAHKPHLVAPVTLEDMPGAQLLHDADPAMSAYVPGAHTEH